MALAIIQGLVFNFKTKPNALAQLIQFTPFDGSTALHSLGSFQITQSIF